MTTTLFTPWQPHCSLHGNHTVHSMTTTPFTPWQPHCSLHGNHTVHSMTTTHMQKMVPQWRWTLLLIVVLPGTGSCLYQQCTVTQKNADIALCTVFPVAYDCGDHTIFIRCLCPASLPPAAQTVYTFNPVYNDNSELESHFKTKTVNNFSPVYTDNSELESHFKTETVNNFNPVYNDNSELESSFKTVNRFHPMDAETGELESTFKRWKFPTDHHLFESFPVDTESKNFVRLVRNAVFSVVQPTPFVSRPVLAAVSHAALQDILDLSTSVADSQDFVDFVSGQLVTPSMIPLSHRYGGHQFGMWADQLGDGRAVTLGEYINRKGQRWELQLKGSGLTPYSRRGDGRAVIRSSVREFLCSEAMFHLGVPTSRAASLVVSDDNVIRDQFYNGNPHPERTAVVLRLARSWFRIGSLEILSHSGEKQLLRQLVDSVIHDHFHDIDFENSGKYLAFFQKIVHETASLMALWQSVGFTHGVCNTDNFSLLSITIDYGPFGFLEAYDPKFVPNTSDDERRYSYENQPDVGAYNLEKLQQALSPLWTESQHALSQKLLQSYGDHYRSEFMHLFRRKLGLQSNRGEEDEQLVAMLLHMMSETRADFTMTFRELSELSLSDLQKREVRQELWALPAVMSHTWFPGWVRQYTSRLRSEEQTEKGRHKLMTQANPRYILRNWVAQAAIERTEQNDFSLLHKLHRVLQQPFTRQEEGEELHLAHPPPQWAASLRVSCSS